MSSNSGSHHNHNLDDRDRHRHRSSHGRDHDRRSQHRAHGHRDHSHHSRSHHEYHRSSSTSRNSPPSEPQPSQQSGHTTRRHQIPPPALVDQQGYPIPGQTIHSSQATTLPMAVPIQLQPFIPPPSINVFDHRPVPALPNTAPNMPFAINPGEMSASALERLQLPQDKITDTGIIPNRAYYDLPAGLMVPLVPLNRVNYQSINPKELRLPFPKFPDENFLRMIDLFYARDRDKRDIDGWDKNFVALYRKQKEALSTIESKSD